MTSKVGAKGQVVIKKEFRDKLGVQPGSMAIQHLVNGYVQIHFAPPAHNRSLRGALAKYVKGRSTAGKPWRKIREAAWEYAIQEKFGKEGPGR
jgi:bifunctional DNA-binding transcriptional regulator/antitoxin component of YhaV-PrlF toxin-antitoxin module